MVIRFWLFYNETCLENEYGERVTTARRFVQFTCALACLFALAGPVSAQSNFKFFEPVTPARKVKIIAHRGMQTVGPENSAIAIRACIDDYVEWAEVDVRMTNDGKHVVLHDETLDRTTNGTGPVANVTLEAFLRLDGGSWYAARFKGQPPLSVEQLLAAARGKVNILLDCKQIDPALLVREILGQKMESQLIVRAPSSVLAQVRAAGKNAIATMGKFEPKMGNFDAFVKDVDPAVVEMSYEAVSPEWCRRFRERGIRVQVYPQGADVPSAWTKLLELGVDLIQTDHPADVRFADVRRRIPVFPVGIAYHRGANRYAPENTIPAIGTAVGLGADYVEVDIRTTQDGKFVLVHDGTLNRTTNGKGPVSAITAEGIAALDAGAWFGQPFIGTRVPTMDEGLDALGEKTGAYLDAKDIPPESLLAAMRTHRLLGRSVVYQSEQYLAKLRALDANVRAMPPLRSAADFERVAATKPFAVDANWQALSEELIGRLHSAGIKVFSDALGRNETVEKYLQAIGWGIDVIQTDHPLRVLRAVELTESK